MWGVGCGVWGLGCRVWGAGCRVVRQPHPEVNRSTFHDNHIWSSEGSRASHLCVKTRDPADQFHEIVEKDTKIGFLARTEDTNLEGLRVWAREVKVCLKRSSIIWFLQNHFTHKPSDLLFTIPRDNIKLTGLRVK